MPPGAAGLLYGPIDPGPGPKGPGAGGNPPSAGGPHDPGGIGRKLPAGNAGKGLGSTGEGNAPGPPGPYIPSPLPG